MTTRDEQPLSPKGEAMMQRIAWNTCEHGWRERVDSQGHSDIQTDVVCVRCGCPGARDERTGTVTWPAT